MREDMEKLLSASGGISQVTNPNGSLIVDIQTPELWENTILLFKPPSDCGILLRQPGWLVQSWTGRHEVVSLEATAMKGHYQFL